MAAPTAGAELRASRSRRRNGELISRVLFWIVVVIIGIYTIFPFYWAIVSSLTPASELFSERVRYFPANPTIDNYVQVFSRQPFARNLLNSLLVAAGTVVVSLLLGSFAAYALGRFRFRGKQIVLYTILSVSMFPQIAVLSGLFTLVRGLGLYNSHFGLIFSYLIFTLPFTVWVLTSFVRQIPGELEEAALVDGASTVQTLWHVLLPVMAPALVTTGLLAFINAWNEFLFALTFTVDNSVRTVPVAIALFSGGSSFESPWGMIMAGSVIVTVPLIILVLVFQNRIVAGLTAGAVKG
jgi:trehalose/maltose transport system permease protein